MCLSEIYECFACKYVCAWCPRKSEEGFRCPIVGVMGVCESPCGWWEPNLGPLIRATGALTHWTISPAWNSKYFNSMQKEVKYYWTCSRRTLSSVSQADYPKGLLCLLVRSWKKFHRGEPTFVTSARFLFLRLISNLSHAEASPGEVTCLPVPSLHDPQLLWGSSPCLFTPSLVLAFRTTAEGPDAVPTCSTSTPFSDSYRSPRPPSNFLNYKEHFKNNLRPARWLGQ